MRNVEGFAREHDLRDILPLLKKGTLIAQNPSFEEVESMDENELETLRYEHAHKWRQLRALFMTIFLCSVGAAVQGWIKLSPTELICHSQKNSKPIIVVTQSVPTTPEISGWWVQ